MAGSRFSVAQRGRYFRAYGPIGEPGSGLKVPARIRRAMGRRRYQVLAVVLIVLFVGPYLVPLPGLRDAQPPEKLADPDSLFIEVDDLTVHCKLAGGGERSVVLLHGFGASLFSWREVATELSKNSTVLAFDRVGFGLTERPLPGDWTGANPYAPEAQVNLTVALMDELGIERAVLVGHSAGGTIATFMALEVPERVEALVLVDPAIYQGGHGLPSFLGRMPPIRRILRLFVRSIGSWGRNLLNRSWHDPSKITPEIMEGYERPLRVENWDIALLEFTLASRNLKLPKRIGSLDLPVLVVTGDDDRIVPTEDSLRLAEEIPFSLIAVIPECGHLPQEERPEAFLDAVLPFIEALD
jgi:pimeloyl-ACP methyl ester carboxylesterase